MVQQKVVPISDSKWKVVKDYYELTYKIKFKNKPSEGLIEDLFKKITLLNQDLQNHLAIKPGLRNKINNPPPMLSSKVH